MNFGIISGAVADTDAWLQSLTGATWAFIFLLISSIVFALGAGKDDDRREAAFNAHVDQPENPAHLARFTALTSIATGKRTVARICFAAACALRLAYH